MEELQREHHAVIDHLLAPQLVSDVGALLRGMHERGEMVPGEVSVGKRGATRSDLMR